jgi:hypothetical protein
MKGTPTQLTCRGALHGYPGSTLGNIIFKLLQDVGVQTHKRISLDLDLSFFHREIEFNPI